MLLFLAAVVVGIVALTWSADRFVTGASGVALHFGISPLVIGMTVVAIGTSAPEILVSVVAALTAAPEIAIGNAVGSNIANVGLALGVAALIIAVPLSDSVKKMGLPALMMLSLLATAVCLDGQLTTLDAAAILLGGAAATYLATRGHPPEELPEDVQPNALGKNLVALALGLAILIGSARLLVWGASEIALAWGVPEIIVGLTIVAIGTSLPEVAACVAGALKGQSDIAIGNVLGSNIFNLGGVFSVAGFITTVEVSDTTLLRDFGTMLAAVAVLLVVAWWPRSQPQVGRWLGGTLLASYLAYLGFLVMESL